VEAELQPSRSDERAAVDGEQAPANSPDPLRVVDSVGDLAVVRDTNDRVEDITGPAPQTSVQPAGARSARLNLIAVGFMLAGSDILCLAAALFMGEWLLGTFESVRMPLVMVLLASALWIAIFAGCRLYTTHLLSAPDEYRRVISATSIGVLILVVTTMGTFAALSRSWIGLTWCLALVFELGARRMWRGVLHRWRRGADFSLRTLVVGTGPEARRLRESLASKKLGFQPVGLVSVNGFVEDAAGHLNELVETIRREHVDCLFVASTEVEHAEMSAIRRAARVAGVDLRVSANIPETLSTRLSLQKVGDVMTITLRPVRLSGPEATVKRAFDLVLATIGLVLAMPLIGLIALAVKLTSDGPVFFKQERVTSGGRAFTVYKFRTMVRDADRILAEQQMDKSEAFFKLRVQPPLTKVGKVLRKYSLDELPQLWNIVRGDMSIVGPRPLPVEQVAANLELLEYRHEVRSGLTGWWQINGRSDIDPEAAVRMDLFYIENWSLALDVYVILKTVAALIKGGGAY
jgi:exopolysaccharide biosynthesis polyprenyl glycosylphosphotransferase